MNNLFKKLKSFFTRQNTLYYPGCMSKLVYERIGKNYEKILNTVGVDFIKLSQKEYCCGSPVISAGYEEEYDDLVEKNKNLFEEAGVKKIITNCPACYTNLRKTHPGLDVEHVTVTLYNALRKNKLELERIGEGRSVTYHDPCHLSRYSGICEEPRFLLESLGFQIKEMKHNREMSLCCGAGAGLINNAEDVCNRIGCMRVEQAEGLNVDLLVTSCPLCYHQLKKNSEDLKVKELSQVILNGL